MKHIYVSILLSAPICLCGQPILTAYELIPQFGPSAPVYLIDHIEPGPTGANFTFDIGGVTLGQELVGTVVSPSETPYASSFPLATHATAAVIGTSNYAYYRATADALYYMGVKGSQDLVLSDHEKLYQIPMTYQTTWTDQWSGSGVQNGQAFTRTGSTTVNYNGHGALVLPTGTINDVARIQFDQTYADVFATGQIDYQSSMVLYMKPGYTTYLLSSTTLFYSVMGGPLLPVASYSLIIDPLHVNIEEFAEVKDTFHLFPNPTSEMATLRSGGRGTYEVHVIDLLGQMVRQPLIVSGSAGQDDVHLDLGGLAAGTYVVRVIDQDGRSFSKPLVIER